MAKKVCDQTDFYWKLRGMLHNPNEVKSEIDKHAAKELIYRLFTQKINLADNKLNKRQIVAIKKIFDSEIIKKELEENEILPNIGKTQEILNQIQELISGTLNINTTNNNQENNLFSRITNFITRDAMVGEASVKLANGAEIKNELVEKIYEDADKRWVVIKKFFDMLRSNFYIKGEDLPDNELNDGLLDKEERDEIIRYLKQNIASAYDDLSPEDDDTLLRIFNGWWYNGQENRGYKQYHKILKEKLDGLASNDYLILPRNIFKEAIEKIQNNDVHESGKKLCLIKTMENKEYDKNKIDLNRDRYSKMDLENTIFVNYKGETDKSGKLATAYNDIQEKITPIVNGKKDIEGDLKNINKIQSDFIKDSEEHLSNEIKTNGLSINKLLTNNRSDSYVNIYKSTGAAMPIKINLDKKDQERKQFFKNLLDNHIKNSDVGYLFSSDDITLSIHQGESPLDPKLSVNLDKAFDKNNFGFVIMYRSAVIVFNNIKALDQRINKEESSNTEIENVTDSVKSDFSKILEKCIKVKKGDTKNNPFNIIVNGNHLKGLSNCDILTQNRVYD